MKTVLSRQAGALRNPPKSVADVLEALSKYAPEFVAQMKLELGQ
jgi:hypothetical protein